ncbi:MAG: LLM class flavin-dependent oxidoreductase [Nitrososphaerota archaeon]|nr:LLM class flavin-dependent oxidoreductase [Nitrososphaerota archaeon]
MLKNLGVTIAWQSATIPSLSALAKAADKCGFGYLWIPEAWGLEAFSTIAHVLTMTEKIKIGSGIVNVFSRSAALIGMTYATLDQISSGRVLLGLGTSGRILVEKWHGIKFEKPLQRVQEYVEVIRKVATGEEAQFKGEVLDISRFRLYTKPAKVPPQIYLGSIGERSLKLAGRICDGAILATYPISKLEHAARLVSEDFSKKVFAYYPLRLTTSDEEAKAVKLEVAKNVAFYVASMGSYYAKNLINLGYEKSVERIMEAHRLEGHRGATGAVDDDLLNDLSFIGSLGAVVEKLSRIPSSVIPVLGLSAASEESVAAGVQALKELSKST